MGQRSDPFLISKLELLELSNNGTVQHEVDKMHQAT